MKKLPLIVIAILTLIVLTFVIGFYSSKTLAGQLTGQTVKTSEKYSFTKAVCDGNSCIDVNISCEGDKIVSLELSSDLKEFPENWEDPRTEEEKEKLCE